MTQSKNALAVITSDHYRTEITTGNHSLIADEPTDEGGTDLGPTPGDFLRSSLAACTAITLRMYADRKKFDVQKIQVEITTSKVDNKTIFNRSIKISGNLDEAQRTRMVQIANLCPTHKILTNPIEVETTLSIVGS